MFAFLVGRGWDKEIVLKHISALYLARAISIPSSMATACLASSPGFDSTNPSECLLIVGSRKFEPQVDEPPQIVAQFPLECFMNRTIMVKSRDSEVVVEIPFPALGIGQLVSQNAFI